MENNSSMCFSDELAKKTVDWMSKDREQRTKQLTPEEREVVTQLLPDYINGLYAIWDLKSYEIAEKIGVSPTVISIIRSKNAQKLLSPKTYKALFSTYGVQDDEELEELLKQPPLAQEQVYQYKDMMPRITEEHSLRDILRTVVTWKHLRIEEVAEQCTISPIALELFASGDKPLSMEEQMLLVTWLYSVSPEPIIDQIRTAIEGIVTFSSKPVLIETLELSDAEFQNIASFFKAVRKNLKISQWDVGVGTPGALSRFENGKRSVSNSFIGGLCIRFQVVPPVLEAKGITLKSLAKELKNQSTPVEEVAMVELSDEEWKLLGQQLKAIRKAQKRRQSLLLPDFSNASVSRLENGSFHSWNTVIAMCYELGEIPALLKEKDPSSTLHRLRQMVKTHKRSYIPSVEPINRSSYTKEYVTMRQLEIEPNAYTQIHRIMTHLHSDIIHVQSAYEYEQPYYIRTVREFINFVAEYLPKESPVPGYLNQCAAFAYQCTGFLQERDIQELTHLRLRLYLTIEKRTPEEKIIFPYIDRLIGTLLSRVN